MDTAEIAINLLAFVSGDGAPTGADRLKAEMEVLIPIPGGDPAEAARVVAALTAAPTTAPIR